MGEVIVRAAEGATGLEALQTVITFGFTQLTTMMSTIKDDQILLLVVVGLPVVGWAITRGKALFHK